MKRIDPFFIWIALFVILMVAASIILFKLQISDRVEYPKEVAVSDPVPTQRQSVFAVQTPETELEQAISQPEVQQVEKLELSQAIEFQEISVAPQLSASNPAVIVDTKAMRRLYLPDWELPPTSEFAGEAEIMRRRSYNKVNSPAWVQFQTWLKQDLPQVWDELISKFYEWDSMPQDEAYEAKRNWILGNSRVSEKIESLSSSDPKELQYLINDLVEWFDWQRYQPRFEVISNAKLNEEVSILEQFHIKAKEAQNLHDFYQAYYVLIEKIKRLSLENQYSLQTLTDEEVSLDRYRVSSRGRRKIAELRASEINSNPKLKELFMTISTPEETQQTFKEYLQEKHEVLYWDLYAKQEQWKALNQEEQNQKLLEWVETNQSNIKSSPIQNLQSLIQTQYHPESLLSQYQSTGVK